MEVRYYEDKRSINAELLRDLDGNIFCMIADELSKRFKVKWIKKIDGFDQRYWDFKFKGVLLTLHLEHYLVIMLYINKTRPDIQKATNLLHELGEHFQTWNPPLEKGK